MMFSLLRKNFKGRGLEEWGLKIYIAIKFVFKVIDHNFVVFGGYNYSINGVRGHYSHICRKTHVGWPYNKYLIKRKQSRSL